MPVVPKPGKTVRALQQWGQSGWIALAMWLSCRDNI